ncbi:MAG TPA: type II toxin-antitoxin system VapC family toxin [Ignavibacteriaceae bacterium]|nr:type II toxin-antitoxin system VapC family toxin [Ignavibacteriaceae bacterium]
MKRYVFDSFALIAYSRGEKGAEIVAEIIDDGLNERAELYLCVVNWGEVYYITLRNFDIKRAELFRTTLAKYPITIVEANKELTLQAAQYKAFNKMSYADAYAAALTKSKKATLVTGDKEFKVLDNDIKINWV